MKLIKIFLITLAFLIPLNASASYTLYLNVSNNIGESQDLRFGVDENATIYVDDSLGELRIPMLGLPDKTFECYFQIYDSLLLEEDVWSYFNYMPQQIEKKFHTRYRLYVKIGDGSSLTFKWIALTAKIDSAFIQDDEPDIDIVSINMKSQTEAVVNNKYLKYFFIDVWWNFDEQDGVNDVTQSYINIYPIPAKDFIIIDNPTMAFFNYKITDILGSNQQQGTLTGSSKININSLPSGIYFLQLDNAFGKSIVKKIIKN